MESTTPCLFLCWFVIPYTCSLAQRRRRRFYGAWGVYIIHCLFGFTYGQKHADSNNYQCIFFLFLYVCYNIQSLVLLREIGITSLILSVLCVVVCYVVLCWVWPILRLHQHKRPNRIFPSYYFKNFCCIN